MLNVSARGWYALTKIRSAPTYAVSFRPNAFARRSRPSQSAPKPLRRSRPDTPPHPARPHEAVVTRESSSVFRLRHDKPILGLPVWHRWKCPRSVTAVERHSAACAVHHPLRCGTWGVVLLLPGDTVPCGADCARARSRTGAVGVSWRSVY